MQKINAPKLLQVSFFDKDKAWAFCQANQSEVNTFYLEWFIGGILRWLRNLRNFLRLDHSPKAVSRLHFNRNSSFTNLKLVQSFVWELFHFLFGRCFLFGLSYHGFWKGAIRGPFQRWHIPLTKCRWGMRRFEGPLWLLEIDSLDLFTHQESTFSKSYMLN